MKGEGVPEQGEDGQASPASARHVKNRRIALTAYSTASGLWGDNLIIFSVLQRNKE